MRRTPGPDGVRLMPCGREAFLLEFPDAEHRRAYLTALTASTPSTGTGISTRADIADVVPGERTVLVKLRGGADRRALASHLRDLLDVPTQPATQPATQQATQPATQPATGEQPALVVPTRYDGPDLAVVADLLGISVEAVVQRHCEQVWRVEFGGFAPGFGYLRGDSGGLDVARRDSPRTRIPAGSVALAGGYSGIYPQASSGGWQLIGRTDLAVWDPDRDPPALLTPGRLVGFEALG